MESRRARLVLLGRRAVGLADWLVPALLLISSLWEIWVGTVFSPGIPGPRGLETVAALLYCGGLLVRRRAPLVALGIVVAGNAGQAPYVSASGQTGLEGFLALLLAVYSVGAHAPRRPGLAALAGRMVVIFLGDSLPLWSNPGLVGGL
jgi:hypothetical protein